MLQELAYNREPWVRVGVGVVLVCGIVGVGVGACMSRWVRGCGWGCGWWVGLWV